jgi:NTP pyrophosphatase (non-canonical NTP hydrolase)
MALIIENISPSMGIQAENVRTKVAKFAICMEQVLKTKDAKYEGRQYNLAQLVEHLKSEIIELADAMDVPEGEKFRLDSIMHECIDVANMCMYVHYECAAIIKFKVN